MGICSSKKKLPLSPSPVEKPATTNPPQPVEPEKKAKKPVFVIAPKPKPPIPDSSEESATKSVPDDVNDKIVFTAQKAEESVRAAAVRTSSCSKEEVDAILIQCGRLSRSASGKTSADRKYSGSKRSYDFDNESDEIEKAVPRPSPRRRTPNRERSGSRERSGGSRRVSRSPGRRSDGPEKPRLIQPQQQPGKLVSVPAREKGGVKSGSATATAGPSRSNSPAKKGLGENAVLSRSNSRKAEQSPFRRNPMAEIDDNSQRTSQAVGRAHKGEEAVRKSSPVRTQSSQRTGEKKIGGTTDASKGSRTSSTTSNRVRQQLMSCRAKEKQADSEVAEEDKAAENQRTAAAARARSSSRRSSRDFDKPTGPNPNPTTYASLLLSDIQNYHQQNVTAVGFSLPACVSKARSILEAVADLNSSSSDQSNIVVDGNNVRSGRGSYISEIVVRDDLMEPSLHKYISVRNFGGETEEPQESAGSNSFVGQPWASLREPDSVESTDRHWASSFTCNDGEEVDFEGDRRQLHRGGSGVSGGGNVNVVRSGGRACSLPVAAASAM